MIVSEYLLQSGLFINNESFYKMCNILQSPQISDFKESHHLIPRSAGGDDNKQNLIDLSLHDHFYVHYYLTMCTFGELKVKMCFAFRQMINTRSIKKFSHFYELSQDDLELFCKKYESLYQEGIFKNNYERTKDIRDKIAEGVSRVNIGKTWCNNGVIERFSTVDDAEVLLSQGWVKGRLKNKNISDKLLGKKRKTREELIEEFNFLVKIKDDKKRMHVHYGSKESYLTGKRISESNIPWEFGRVPLPNKPENMTDDEYRKQIQKEASLKAAKQYKGMHWFTNGIVNIRSYSCPEGFYPGKVNTK